ncbi:MAG: GH116 family glycosyl-hydrolase [Anaerolineae bacterium]|jgi:uncharacterized protein (DUF608 family)|nr:GH116 family glycosyl-hydrolase [Anaerolineae bacterium]
MLEGLGFTYQKEKTRQISFPLGGIGTGCIGLGGDGRLIDWEIFNKPNKRSRNGFSHFAIKAEDADGKLVDARILNGPLQPPFDGGITPQMYDGFGFGPAIGSMAGFPHFEDNIFHGAFPFAAIELLHEDFPGEICLGGFNPFIPGNAFDSSIPAAFFNIHITNTSDQAITYTVVGALSNPLPAHQIHQYVQQERLHCMHLGTTAFGNDPANFHLGDMTLATDAAEVSYQQYNYHGGWFDALEVYWHDLCAPGKLKPRHYDNAGANNIALLAAHRTVQPGESCDIHFVIAWNFPNMENYWNESAQQQAKEKGVPNQWKNYYATEFVNSLTTAGYALSHWQRLQEESMAFTQTLFETTIPEEALDAISANLAVLKSPTVLRLEDGSFYGFEGCHAKAGCCEGSCTHVWNYSQALAFLFPSLERSMRDLNYRYNLNDKGGLRFRLQLPLALGPDVNPFRPCVDGQFGDVLKTYRDWKLCGDDEWLRSLWPAIKASVEYAWSPDNPDKWDPDQRGVLTGRQHHTLDMELFSPSSWLNGFYLGALKAAAEMADAMDDADTASLYRAIFAKGKAWTDKHLFNGDYYQQQIDLNDRSLLEGYSGGILTTASDDVAATYWDEEHGEIKYQVGEGCSIDQVLAQWHADLYGLGEIHDTEQTNIALQSLFNHNFKSPMREHFNPMRLFAIEEESGLIMCAWPEGKRRPVIPVVYASEVFTGTEYSAASLMIARGLVQEGMAVVKAVRDRFDGERRNPWNEFECGSNYARSMASYALLNAFSGFQFDLREGMLGFDPIQKGEIFESFWSVNGAWGKVQISEDEFMLTVRGGEIALKKLRIPMQGTSCKVNGEMVEAIVADGAIIFEKPLVLKPDAPLLIE